MIFFWQIGYSKLLVGVNVRLWLCVTDFWFWFDFGSAVLLWMVNTKKLRDKFSSWLFFTCDKVMFNLELEHYERVMWQASSLHQPARDQCVRKTPYSGLCPKQAEIIINIFLSCCYLTHQTKNWIKKPLRETKIKWLLCFSWYSDRLLKKRRKMEREGGQTVLGSWGFFLESKLCEETQMSFHEGAVSQASQWTKTYRQQNKERWTEIEGERVTPPSAVCHATVQCDVSLLVAIITTSESWATWWTLTYVRIVHSSETKS